MQTPKEIESELAKQLPGCCGNSEIQKRKPTGLELISSERYRQISNEGWTSEHDDQHFEGDLARAAACYAVGTKELRNDEPSGLGQSFVWPWGSEWWKPSPDNRIRDLAKAGALIAAEIDRLQRLSGGGAK